MVAIALCAPAALGQAPALPGPGAVIAPAPAGGEAPSARFARELAAVSQHPDRRSAPHRAGIEHLRQLLNDYPQDPNAHLAALALTEDRLCETDAGFPDCAAWAIRSYETFLQAYPYTSRRSYVLKQLATNYLDLSFRYEEDQPWQSLDKAELCLGRALELAETLAKRPDAEAQFGRDLAVRIRQSGKAYSVVPGLGGGF